MPQYPRFHYLYPKNPIASARIIVGGDQSETNELSGRKVQTVEIQGIHFRREEALNYLSARNFEIQSSDIKVYDLTREKKQANADADSLVQALSLYDVISPVLHSISVDQIRNRANRTSLFLSLERADRGLLDP